MGFRPKRTKLDLDFTGTDYEGLEITAYSISFDRLMQLEKLAARARELKASEGIGEVEELIKEFLRKVDHWNLEYPDSGEPTPITYIGFTKHETSVVIDLTMTWYEGIIGVSKEDPLDEQSNSGNTFLEESIPMAPLQALPAQ